MVIQGSTATRAEISTATLTAAATAAAASGASVADLRRDAYGHGLAQVARAVGAAGIGIARVDGDAAVRMLQGEGISASTTATPDVDPAALYGLRAGDRAPMRLYGHVLSLKPLRRGEGVSYGYSHVAEADTTVALVTGGYAQGIVRALGNRAAVEIDGAAYPIVGRVAMDVCVVDVGETPVRAGSEVTYFGGAGPAAGALTTWSTITGLSPAELATVCGLRAVRTEGGVA